MLAGIAVGLLVVAFVALPETLPPSRRIPPSFRATGAAYASLFRDRTFVLLVVIAALLFSTLFAYIAGSPFVLQDFFGLSAQQFGVAFGLNAVGLVIATQLNPWLLRRYTPMQILSVAIGVSFAAAAVLFVFALTGFGGLLGFAIPMGVALAAIGLSFPNAPAVALSRHGNSAGTAAAMLGAAQFGIGGLIAPVVGLLSNGTPVPLTAVIATTTGLSAALVVLGRRRLNAS